MGQLLSKSDPSGPKPPPHIAKRQSQEPSRVSVRKSNVFHGITPGQGFEDNESINNSSSGSLQRKNTDGSLSSSEDGTAAGRRDSFKNTVVVNETYDEDGNKLVNEYAIIKKLGKGSYGKVKLCMNIHNNQAYAMKIMNKSLLKRMKKGSGHDALQDVRREIAILKKLDHKNIVRLFEVIDDEENDKLFLILEYVENGPVMTLGSDGMSSTGPLDHEKARKYLRDVIEGLEYLHAQKIIHRDIKPENLLLDHDYNVKLSDFGVSQIMEGENDTLNETAGTPAFLPPEAVASANFAGKPADIWAIGVTLYIFIFGRCPFIADNYALMYEMIKNSPVPIPEDTNPYLKDLFLKILEKDPSKRITLSQLKKHPWVTADGQLTPLPTQPRTKSITISNEELDRAIVSGKQLKLVDKMALMVKMKSKFGKKAEAARARSRSNAELMARMSVVQLSSSPSSSSSNSSDAPPPPTTTTTDNNNSSSSSSATTTAPLANSPSSSPSSSSPSPPAHANLNDARTAAAAAATTTTSTTTTEAPAPPAQANNDDVSSM